MRTHRVTLVVLGMFFYSVAAAGATSFYGADPNLTSDDSAFCGVGDICPLAFVQDKVGNVAQGTAGGVITRLELEADGPMDVVVFNPTQRTASTLAATYIDGASFDGQGQNVLTALDAQIPIAAGQMVGIRMSAGSTLYAKQNANSRAFQGTSTGSGDINTTSVLAPATDLLYQATIEPDADDDGFGDETQDGCPSSAASQGACPSAQNPAPTPLPRAPFVQAVTAATSKVKLGSRNVRAKKGSISLALSNSNPIKVSGKIKLKLGKKKAGSKSYALKASGSGAVKVKLSSKARRTLKKRGKVSLGLKLTAKGKTGKTFTTKATIKVKPAKKAKKRKAKPPQPQTPVGSTLDGKYVRDPLSGPNITFTVTGGGRKIVNLTGSQSGSCFLFDPGGGGSFAFAVMYPAMTSIDVAADGSFAKTEKLSDTTTEITKGKLANGVVTGYSRVKRPYCSGGAEFKSVKQ